LTNFLKIAAIGDLSELAQLRAEVRRVVDDIADQDIREGAWDAFGASNCE
jgi:hypothetical protein